MRTLKSKDRSRLIKAAMGQLPCDLTVSNVKYLNMFTGEIYPAEVDVLDGFVVRVREEGVQAPAASKETYDGKGAYLIPGFIDAHMHVESTMMIPENVSRGIVPWGTTTICTDPHEIGNVMGVEGVRFMLENAKKSALRQYVLAPSCVPAVPGRESTGAVFTAKEVGTILDMDDVVGVAEVMDYVGVVTDNERMHSIVEEGLKRDLLIQAHAPFVTGDMLNAYRIGGPLSDHESTCAAEVREKLRAGMYVDLRASSIVDGLAFLVDGCRDHYWKDHVAICTDDVHASDLLTVGHINKVVKKTIAAGIDPRDAIKMATYNAAREYGFDDLGALAPGYIADMQLVRELDGGKPEAVFIEGKLVAENGCYLAGDTLTEAPCLPNTVTIPQLNSTEDFVMRVPEGYMGSTIMVNVMTVSPASPILRMVVPTELPVKDGAVDISGDPSLTFVCCANRYGTGSKTIAVYRDFGLLKGAFASTVSHDSHNLTIVYRDPAEALLAAKTLQSVGGGILVAEGEKETHVALPAAGLMSYKPCAGVAEEINALQKVIDEVSGGRLTVLASAILALPVLPGVVITDMGLVDGTNQSFVPVFAL